MEIREYDNMDKYSIIRLFEAVGDYHAKIDPTGLSTKLDGYGETALMNTLRTVNKQKGRFYVAIKNGRIVGFATASVKKKENDRIALNNLKIGRIEIQILPYRKIGNINSKLIEKAEKYLRKIGCKMISASYLASDSTVSRLYLKHGYKKQVNWLLKTVKHSEFRKCRRRKVDDIIKIKEFENKDKVAVIRLLEEFGDTEANIDPTGLSKKLEGYGKTVLKETLMEVSKGNCKLYIAVKKNEVVGFVKAAIDEEITPITVESTQKIGTIYLICVSERYRNNKIGTKLIDTAERYLISSGCKLLWIGYFAPNYKAGEWFMKRGYKVRRIFMLKALKLKK